MPNDNIDQQNITAPVTLDQYIEATGNLQGFLSNFQSSLMSNIESAQGNVEHAVREMGNTFTDYAARAQRSADNMAAAGNAWGVEY